MIDIERERAQLLSCREEHRQRVNHLREKIERGNRELRVHEIFLTLIENDRLPESMRSLSQVAGIDSAPSDEVRALLTEHGVAVPGELRLSAHSVDQTVGLSATYLDDFFPAELSWSAGRGFEGRIMNASSHRASALSVSLEGE